MSFKKPTTRGLNNISPSLKDIKDYFNSIVELIITSYNRLYKIGGYKKVISNLSSEKKKDIEDVLRNKLVAYMQQVKKELGLYCWIHSEPSTYSENSFKTKGRIDISIYSSFISPELDEKKYFSFECKRVSQNKWSKDIKSHYINDGLQRYIDLTYSKFMNMGGMIAFVEEGDFSSVASSLFNKIKAEITNKTNLMDKSPSFNHDYVYSSMHIRSNSSNINLYHLVFDFSNIPLLLN